jgi:hypothetical protein
MGAKSRSGLSEYHACETGLSGVAHRAFESWEVTENQTSRASAAFDEQWGIL